MDADEYVEDINYHNLPKVPVDDIYPNVIVFVIETNPNATFVSISLL